MPTQYTLADKSDVDLMHEVISRHERFSDLRKFGVVIEVLMAWSDNDQPIKHHGAVAIASVKVVGGEERANGGPDVRIKIDAKRYLALGKASREAVFAHELYHIEVQYSGGDGVKRDPYGRPVIKTIPDDWTINGFQEVAEWYGEASIERRSYQAVGGLLEQRRLFPSEGSTTEVEPDDDQAEGDDRDVDRAESGGRP